jgi:phospholipid/cholesterol/gamma-HCH transport system substrate-binding protein
VLVGGLLLWTLTFTGAIPKLFQGGNHVVKADFASIQDIVPNDPVRVHGVDVGHVADSTPDPGGRSAMLTLELGSGAPPIYSDATASIRWRTALGANEAVTIDPGTPSAGLLGQRTIPLSQTSDQVELDQITRSVHGGAQSGVRTMLQQLGPAFSNHTAPAATFNTLARVAPVVTTGIGAARGLIRDTDLKDLVKQAGEAANALNVGASASYTKQFAEAAATTLAATSASQADIRATIADAGAVLPHAARTLSGVDHALYLLDPLVAKLDPVAPTVAPTVAQLHPTLVHLNTLLHDAKPLLHTLRPAVDSLAGAARVGVPVINALAPSLARLDQQILPGLDWVSPESKHATYQMIGGIFVGFTDGGLGTGFNQDGFYGRLLGSGSQNSVTDFLPCKLEFSGATPADFLACETLMAALNQYLTPGANLLGPFVRRLEAQHPQFAQRLLKGVTKLGVIK